MAQPSSGNPTPYPADTGAQPTRSFEPIAIVGVGLRAPGGIDGIPALWDTLVQGKSHNTRLYDDPTFNRRFDPVDFEEMFKVTPEAKNELHGNILQETPGLDEAFFGVSKRESLAMDVQMKLVMHVAHEALEDAGFNGKRGSTMDPNTFGVYLGSSSDDFFKDTKDYPIDIYHLIRNQRAFQSGQLSWAFDLRGPSVSVDTVCSSSMTAFNDACRALANRECDTALAGGVHVLTQVSAPPAIMSLKLAGFLDPTGQCKPFLVDGKGYCRAEACGLAVLKRLSDAERDGDRIHGIIRGTGVSNMAHYGSIVRPEAELQALAMERAVASSGVDIADISYVEAHGPGTQKGDPAELASICNILAPAGSRSPEDDRIIIGSIKGNLGHSEAASGSSSLFKVLAMMRYGSIPPQANFSQSRVNPVLRPFLDNHHIRIIDRQEKWAPKRGGPLRAIVGNFGATGWAGQLVLEAPPAAARDGPETPGQDLPFLVSAKHVDALELLRERYARWLESDGAAVPLRDISYTMTARRVHYTHYVIFKAGSHQELADKLRDASIPVHRKDPKMVRRAGFCYAGQGGPRLNPRATSVYGTSTAFTAAVDECFRLAREEKLVAPEDDDMLELFALEYGLASMWKEWGMQPSAVAGHSFGEYSALVHAGVLSLRDGLRAVGSRAALVREKCSEEPGRMAALRLPLTDVCKLIEASGARIEIACINAFDKLTIAGTLKELEDFREEVIAAHPAAKWQLIEGMKLAFHSRFTEPLLDDFQTVCNSLTFQSSTATVLSGPLGRVCPPGDEALLKPNYLVHHCRDANKFGVAILDHQKSDAEVSKLDWIEVGPHSTTAGFIPSTPGQVKVASQRKGADGWGAVLDAAISLQIAGQPIDFAAFHRDTSSSRRLADLPKYPMKLVPSTYVHRRAAQSPAPAPAPANVVPAPTAQIRAEDVAPIMKGHIVAGYPICPASIYMSLSLAAIFKGSEGVRCFRISGLAMNSPFTALADNFLQAIAVEHFTSVSKMEVRSKTGQVHATMQVELVDEAKMLSAFALLKPLVWGARSLQNDPGSNKLDRRLTYALFGLTVGYGEHGQGLERVWLSPDGMSAWAVSSNKPKEVEERLHHEPAAFHKLSPVLIDRACQLVGMMINTSPKRPSDELFVASEVDSMEFSLGKLEVSTSFQSYASFEVVEEKGHGGGITAVGQVYTFDMSGNLVAAFRGVRMRRMKQRLVELVVARAAGGPVPAAPSTSKPVAAKAPAALKEPTVIPPTPLACDDTESEPDMDESLRGKIAQIFQTTLGVESIDPNANLSELGLDSLTSVEIGVELERLLPEHQLPPELLVEPDTTLQVVYNALDLSASFASTEMTYYTAKESMETPAPVKAVEPVAPVKAFTSDNGELNILPPEILVKAAGVLKRIGNNPEVIRSEPGGHPLMLIHDGGGTALAYHTLRPMGRTLLGIHSPGLDKGQGISSVEQAADEYAEIARQWLREHPEESHSKIFVSGWSLGGTIAVVMGTRHPDLVAGVVMIDPPPPRVAALTPEEVDQLIPANANKAAGGGFSELVKRQLAANAKAFAVDADHKDGQRHLVEGLRTPTVLITARDSLGHSAAKNFVPEAGSYSEWALSPRRAQMAEDAWQDLLGSCLIESMVTPGDHFSLWNHRLSGETSSTVQRASETLEAWLSG